MHLFGGSDLPATESRKASVAGTYGPLAVLCPTQGGRPKNLVGREVLCFLDWGVHSNLAGVFPAAVAVTDGIRGIRRRSIDPEISVMKYASSADYNTVLHYNVPKKIQGGEQ